MEPKLDEIKEDNSSSVAITNEIKNEKDKIDENLTEDMSIVLTQKTKKSVCEIIKDSGYGLGFFCKLKLDGSEICCLFSNNHVISQDILSNDLNIKLNEETYNISLKLKRRIWNDKNLDFVCIEIMEEDNLISKIEPFEIDENNYNIDFELEKYDKRGIVIASLGGKSIIDIPQGEIYCIENINEKFIHNCNTEEGLSGGPIILTNNLKIMGIDIGFDKNSKKNTGIYITDIIEKIEKKVIKCTINIKLNEVKDDILLFNLNLNNREEIEDNFKVYFNNKILEINNRGNRCILNKFNFEKD